MWLTMILAMSAVGHVGDLDPTKGLVGKRLGAASYY